MKNLCASPPLWTFLLLAMEGQHQQPDAPQWWWEGRAEGLQSDPLSWKDFTRLFETLTARSWAPGGTAEAEAEAEAAAAKLWGGVGDYVSGTQGEGESRLITVCLKNIVGFIRSV